MIRNSKSTLQNFFFQALYLELVPENLEQCFLQKKFFYRRQARLKPHTLHKFVQQPAIKCLRRHISLRPVPNQDAEFKMLDFVTSIHYCSNRNIVVKQKTEILFENLKTVWCGSSTSKPNLAELRFRFETRGQGIIYKLYGTVGSKSSECFK